MDVLNILREYKASGKHYTHSLYEASLWHNLFTHSINEDADPKDVEAIKRAIANGDYVRNDYKRFADELRNNKRNFFLSKYEPEEMELNGMQTYNLKDYPIGFALQKSNDSDDVDIVGVHNNSNIGGVGEDLVDSAVSLGGNTLDHYDGFLSDFYGKKGFEEYHRVPWNDKYADPNWDYEKYGKLDVVYRRLKRK